MKRVYFIGQAPPRTDPSRPFGRSKLYGWLESIGIGLDLVDSYFSFGALVGHFPGSKNGSHKLPTPAEIKDYLPEFKEKLLEVNPDIVIPVGKLSICYCLGREQIKLEEEIGKIYQIDPYAMLGRKITVIPFPHPSGASSWYYKEANKPKLAKALQLLKTGFNPQKSG
jgi:uracil-DNA glycosylase